MVCVGIFVPVLIVISNQSEANGADVMTSLFMLAIAGAACTFSGINVAQRNYRKAWLFIRVSFLLVIPILIVVFSA